LLHYEIANTTGERVVYEYIVRGYITLFYYFIPLFTCLRPSRLRI